jgi:hypothetical protein
MCDVCLKFEEEWDKLSFLNKEYTWENDSRVKVKCTNPKKSENPLNDISYSWLELMSLDL